MIPYIKEFEPPRRRLRIRSKIRFIIFLTIILFTLFTLLIHSIGESQTIYKPYKVRYGETYWDIARQLQAQGYKPKADIRSIVHEIIETSGIPAHELKEGDTILIPIKEGVE